MCVCVCVCVCVYVCVIKDETTLCYVQNERRFSKHKYKEMAMCTRAQTLTVITILCGIQHVGHRHSVMMSSIPVYIRRE